MARPWDPGSTSAAWRNLLLLLLLLGYHEEAGE